MLGTWALQTLHPVRRLRWQKAMGWGGGRLFIFSVGVSLRSLGWLEPVIFPPQSPNCWDDKHAYYYTEHNDSLRSQRGEAREKARVTVGLRVKHFSNWPRKPRKGTVRVRKGGDGNCWDKPSVGIKTPGRRRGAGGGGEALLCTRGGMIQFGDGGQCEDVTNWNIEAD